MKKIVTLLMSMSLLLMWAPVQAKTKGELVAELFAVMGLEQQVSGGFDAMMPVIDQVSINLSLNSEEKQELMGIYKDWFENVMDHGAITAQLAEIYADNFSAEELQAYIAFYQTPAGQKMVAKMPELMKIGAQLGFDEAQSKQAVLIEKLKPFIDRHSAK